MQIPEEQFAGVIEGIQPGETLRGVDSMGSIRSQSSTRGKKRKGKKRKSLTAVFDEGNPTAADSVVEQAPPDTISQQKMSSEHITQPYQIPSDSLNVKVVPGETVSEGLKLGASVEGPVEQKENEKGLVVDVVGGEGGPAVESELAKQDEVEVGMEDGLAVGFELKKQDEVEVGARLDANVIDVNLGSEATLLVAASSAKEIPPTEDIMENDPITETAVMAPTDRQDGSIASGSQPSTPKNRLRRLMGKAIKLQPRNGADGQSVETPPTETPELSPLTPVNPELSPSTAETKLPRLSRKPRLAKLSEELSLWMKADKKINDPASIPTRYSQSMPSLIPSVSASSSRIPVPGGSRRESSEYNSSGQASPIGPSTDTAPSPTTLSHPQLLRLQRVMTEPTVQKHVLPVRHYPATTDDIPSYESRIPRRPSQTIRLVDPDPEDIATLQTSKLQSVQQSLNRFGFSRTPSQSSLTTPSFQDSVDESPPPPSPLPISGGTRFVSDSTPTLAHVSNTSPSGSTVSLGLFRSKTWGFDKDKGKDKGKEKKEKKEKEKKEKKVIL